MLICNKYKYLIVLLKKLIGIQMVYSFFFAIYNKKNADKFPKTTRLR